MVGSATGPNHSAADSRAGRHPASATRDSSSSTFSFADAGKTSRFSQLQLKMPPRFTLTLNPSAGLRIGRLAARQARYSTEANAGPLIRVTDLPAPSSGHIRILELNRPAARNAISRGLLFSLREEIDAIHAQYDAATGEEIATPSWSKRFGGAAGDSEKGPTRALILASAVNTSFCAGADLKERKTFTQDE